MSLLSAVGTAAAQQSPAAEPQQEQQQEKAQQISVRQDGQGGAKLARAEREAGGQFGVCQRRPRGADVAARVPQTKDYRYALADNRVLLVAPVGRFVVGVFMDDIQVPKAAKDAGRLSLSLCRRRHVLHATAGGRARPPCGCSSANADWS